MGSASGNSAAVWGRELQQNQGVLVAFDTWNGDLDMWLSEGFRDVMGWQVPPAGAAPTHMWLWPQQARGHSLLLLGGWGSSAGARQVACRQPRRARAACMGSLVERGLARSPGTRTCTSAS